MVPKIQLVEVLLELCVREKERIHFIQEKEEEKQCVYQECVICTQWFS